MQAVKGAAPKKQPGQQTGTTRYMPRVPTKGMLADAYPKQQAAEPVVLPEFYDTGSIERAMCSSTAPAVNMEIMLAALAEAVRSLSSGRGKKPAHVQTKIDDLQKHLKKLTSLRDTASCVLEQFVNKPPPPKQNWSQPALS